MSAALFEKYEHRLHNLRSSSARWVHPDTASTGKPCWRIRNIEVVLERIGPWTGDHNQRFKIVANLGPEDHLVEAWGLPQSMTFQEALILLRLHGNDL